MDEQLKARLISYLDKLEASVGRAAGFAESEVPEVVSQWLAWEFWSNLSICLIVIAAFVAWLFIAARIVRVMKGMYEAEVKKNSRYDGFFEGLIGFGSIAVSIALFVAAAHWASVTGYRALKVSLAPKVVVVEKISEIARGR